MVKRFPDFSVIATVFRSIKVKLQGLFKPSKILISLTSLECKKVALRKKQFEAEKKWRASEKGKAYRTKIMAEQGIFPATTSEERVWRDIWRATQNKNRDSRFKVVSKIPEKVKSAKTGNLYVPWSNNYKKCF